MTNDVSGAVKAAKSGRVDFKIDKTAIVHVGLGKVWDMAININTHVPSEFINIIMYIVKQLLTLQFCVVPHYSLCCFLQINFSEESLRENIGAFVNALLLAKPVGLKKSK